MFNLVVEKDRYKRTEAHKRNLLPRTRTYVFYLAAFYLRQHVGRGGIVVCYVMCTKTVLCKYLYSI